MNKRAPDHGLEFLLAFNGRVHHLEKGYWLKFEITRGKATPERPFMRQAARGSLGSTTRTNRPGSSDAAKLPITGIAPRLTLAGRMCSRMPRP
jgi:hypothetical protein